MRAALLVLFPLLTAQNSSIANRWQPLSTVGPEAQLLATQRTAVDRLLDTYNYPPSTAAWRIGTSTSPWLHAYVLYRFESVDGGDRLSLVVARGAVPAGAWELALAPERRQGKGDTAPQSDPYNYAAFNATLSTERPLPHDAAAWVQWTQLYLDLAGLDDTPVLADRVHADLSPRLNPMTYGPQVFNEGAGYTGVQVYTLSGTGVREYGVDFNAEGKLRGVLFSNGTRSQPPTPLRALP